MDSKVEDISTSESTTVFGPLVFEDNNDVMQNNVETPCLLCEDIFNLKLSLPMFLAHLFDVHSVVIEDAQNIHNLNEYILYWRNRLKNCPIEQIIPSLTLDTSGQQYFLMSALLEEDKELRHRLKLEHALNVQEFERSDKNYDKQCLFCRFSYKGSRQGYLEHLSSQHNLQLGNSQNLVFIEELINNIEDKINNLKCIYCEKTFTDRNVLKEHMRKKIHKRINPENKEYDKFYIVNYLEKDKSWRVLQYEDDRYAISRGEEANADEEYSDWNGQGDQIICLFCKHKEVDINLLCLHMENKHQFNFGVLTQELDFYQKVKLINYIRKQIHDHKCIICGKNCENFNELEKHLIDANHYKLPDYKLFDQPEFYFPTYENDAFLYLIDDVED